MRFGLVVHTGKKRAIEVAKEILSFLNEKGEEVIVEEGALQEKKFFKGVPGLPLEKMDVDVMITVGGDGTLLRTLQKNPAPVMGVNVGEVGFLTDVNPDSALPALERVLEGNYVIEERSKLQTIYNGERLPDATNEAVLHTASISKMQKFEIYVDMYWAELLRADGIIISTPTGSTCYAMSAGGPILDPRVNALILVPIAPYKISARPIVLPDHAVITIKVAHPRRKAVLVIDGAYQVKISKSDSLLFTKSKAVARFIKFDLNFYKHFQEKMR
ncbi:MAG: NAD(+) kinase [Deltaproteobacteria bacterium]|nr:NAD(+)/NADH kinase [Thermoplasmata archaeon]RLA77876.1 MAG: NAD(+) kinase [Deltaproteobacteria bacterium]